MAASAVMLGLGAPAAGFASPLSAEGKPQATLRVGEATLEVFIAPGLALSQRQLLDWIADSAAEVSNYFGAFPVERATIELRRTASDRIGFGSAVGSPRPFIFVNVGDTADIEDLRDDWVMVHEMVHLAFPNLARTHRWLKEGSATYVEPFARLASGRVDEAWVWRFLLRKLPHGLPAAGDEGLDRTPTWGRIYWGGALWCLIADVEIRRRTHNGYGLRHALAAILEAGGDMRAGWSIEKTLRIGDAAVGVPVMSELYAEWKHTPVNVDLDGLLAELGVVRHAGGVHLDPTAPLARIRTAISYQANLPLPGGCE